MIGTFVVPLVLFTIWGAWQYTREQEHDLLEHAEKMASISSEILGTSVGMGLSEGSFDLVQKSYNLVRRDSHFIYIGIFDEAGVPLIEYNPNLTNAIPSGFPRNTLNVEYLDNAILVEAPALYQGTTYGRVVTVYSLNQVFEKLNGTRVATGFVALLVLAIGLYGCTCYGGKTRRCVGPAMNSRSPNGSWTIS